MYICINLKKFLKVFFTLVIIAAGLAAVLVPGLGLAAIKISGEADETYSNKESAASHVLLPKSDADSGSGVFIPVIMYHSLLMDESRHNEYCVSPETFYEDMEYLSENGFTTVFISEITGFTEYGGKLPEKPVVITFDDGLFNVLHYAYPFMKEKGLKGVVNVVGSYTEKSEKEGDHNPYYSSLTWNEIAKLNESGIFEIGNHTYDMHSLDNSRKGCKKLPHETEEEYGKTLNGDIGKLQRLLAENSGITPYVFAYPYGFISEESIDILGKMGFKALLTCFEKPNYITGDEDILLLNRYNRPGDVPTAEFMRKALENF